VTAPLGLLTRKLVLCGMLIALLLLMPGAGVAQTQEQINAALERALARLNVQEQLPSERAVQAPPDDRRELDGPTVTDPQPEKKIGNRSPWPKVLKLLGWMAALCGVALAAVWLSEAFPQWNRPVVGESGTAGEGDVVQTGRTRLQHALTEADRFAAEGLYAEAMHHLLLATVAILRRRSDGDFGDSLTSRELVRTLRLPLEQRRAFSDIIAHVEKAWFGGYSVDPPDYAAVRACFLELELSAPGGT
jgi:hypothetical protein